MSASLVGSEMCIRDRRRNRCVQACWGGRLDTPVARRGDFSGVPSSIAVSYTHLTLPTICSV
eukprot:7476637-Alexandrium_andersonii.AAC.1